jgi:hypothetical protein
MILRMKVGQKRAFYLGEAVSNCAFEARGRNMKRSVTGADNLEVSNGITWQAA